MKISTEIIKSLNPCAERFNNYLKHYRDFNGETEDFLVLENITFEDKIWVMTRLMTKDNNIKFAIKCAEAVLNVFEQKYPNDQRPKKAVEAAKNFLKYNSVDTTRSAYEAAHAALTTANINNNASHACDAAAYVAHAAGNIAYASAYSARTAHAATKAGLPQSTILSFLEQI